MACGAIVRRALRIQGGDEVTQVIRMSEIAQGLLDRGFMASVQELRPNILPPFILIECPKGNPYSLIVSPEGFTLLGRDELQTVITTISGLTVRAIVSKIHAHTNATEWGNE
jgi:hypothetical protein